MEGPGRDMDDGVNMTKEGEAPLKKDEAARIAVAALQQVLMGEAGCKKAANEEVDNVLPSAMVLVKAAVTKH